MLTRLKKIDEIHYKHLLVSKRREEKKIELDRSSVTKIRNQAEKDAERWYIELRDLSAKYIAIYKDRLEPLMSYQNMLHELINQSQDKSSEVVLRSISELHRIEL